MSNYYYLAAQLPSLRFSYRSQLSSEYFLNEARKWLNEKDFFLLSEISINDFIKKRTDSYLLREYKRFDYALRKDISFLRRETSLAGSYNPSVQAKDIFAIKDPLEREKQLLLLRWKFIEEKEEGHCFDLDFLIAYFLKMQILEKLFTFNKDEGLLVFDRVCEVKL